MQIRYEISQNSFCEIPGGQIAYWITKNKLSIFKNRKIGDDFTVRNGISTGNNDKYLRLWFEISLSNKDWKYCNKGGAFRKWYGNNEYVIYWKDDGKDIRTTLDEKGRIKARLGGIEHSFEEGLEMSRVTSGNLGFRYSEKGFVYESTTNDIYKERENQNLKFLLGYCNSSINIELLELINPTINIMPEDIRNLPYQYPSTDKCDEVENLANSNIQISKEDWDAFETSWDFKKHPLI